MNHEILIDQFQVFIEEKNLFGHSLLSSLEPKTNPTGFLDGESRKA